MNLLQNLGLGITVTLRNMVSGPAKSVISSLMGIQKTANDTSRGISRSIQNLGWLQVTGYRITEMGTRLREMGMTGVEQFKKLGESVIETSSEFERYRVSLEALYHSTAKGDQMFNWAKQQSIKYPMTIMSIDQLMTELQGAGLDITQNFSKHAGQQYNLLTAISDLTHGLNLPDTRRPALGIIEAADANNFTEFSRGLRIPRAAIEKAMGQAFSTDMTNVGKQQRLDEIVSYIEERFGGLTQKLQGSWFTLRTDFQDMWINFKGAIGSSGFFQDFESTMWQLYDFLRANSAQVVQFADEIGSAFKMIWDFMKPLITGAERLFLKLTDFAKVHPSFTKFAAILFSVGSLLLVVAGTFLTFAGNAISAVATLGILNLELAKTAREGIRAGSILNGMFHSMIMGTLYAGLFAAASFLIYEAWSNNFDGIRTTVMNFVDEMKTGLTNVWSLLNVSNFSSFQILMKTMEIQGTNFGWVVPFATNLARIVLFFQDLFGMQPSDGLMRFFLYTNNLQAVQNVQQIANNIRSFFSGIATGSQSALSTITDFAKILEQAFKPVKPLLDEIAKVLNSVSSSNKNTSGFKDFGMVVGYIGTFLVFSSILGRIVGFIKAIPGAVLGFSLLRGAIGGIGRLLMGTLGLLERVALAVVGVVAGILGLPVELVAGIVIALAALTTLVIMNWSSIKSYIINNVIIPVQQTWEQLPGNLQHIWDTIKTDFQIAMQDMGKFISQYIVQPLETMIPPWMRTFITRMTGFNFNVNSNPPVTQATSNILMHHNPQLNSLMGYFERNPGVLQGTPLLQELKTEENSVNTQMNQYQITHHTGGNVSHSSNDTYHIHLHLPAGNNIDYSHMSKAEMQRLAQGILTELKREQVRNNIATGRDRGNWK